MGLHNNILSILKILKSCLNFFCLDLSIHIHPDGYAKSKKQMCVSNQLLGRVSKEIFKEWRQRQ
jgi:hypothetical protein